MEACTNVNYITQEQEKIPQGKCIFQEARLTPAKIRIYLLLQ